MRRSMMSILIVSVLFLMSGCYTNKRQIILDRIMKIEEDETIHIIDMVKYDTHIAVIAKARDQPERVFMFNLMQGRLYLEEEPKTLVDDRLLIQTRYDERDSSVFVFLKSEKTRRFEMNFSRINGEKGSLSFDQMVTENYHIFHYAVPFDYSNQPEIKVYDEDDRILYEIKEAAWQP